MTQIPRLMIAGTSSGVGKTSVTLGLMKAFQNKGLIVQAFKVGPDYLDPMHHSRITGRPSRNLDSWMCEDHLEEILQHGSEGADIAIIEGVMGLYDGMSGDSDLASSAEVAKRLKIPVVLVADAKAMARSFAALLHGYISFDPELEFAGVIANRVSGDSHFEYLENAVSHHLDVPLLGYLPPDKNISLPDRHLGLVAPQSNEFEKIYEDLGTWVNTHLDVDTLWACAQTATPLPDVTAKLFAVPEKKSNCRVAVAKDSAFHFYYQDNLDVLELLGAKLIEFSPLIDKKIPDCDLLLLGGGYPESHAAELSANKSMLASIKEHAKQKSIYAECGGMMLLCKELENLAGEKFSMSGVFEETVVMTARRKALGYVEVSTLNDSPLGPKNSKARGHEFHYSEIKESISPNKANHLRRPIKETEKEDGMNLPNVQASYAHVHFSSNPEMAQKLLEAAQCLKA